jgi:hypothetical protein
MKNERTTGVACLRLADEAVRMFGVAFTEEDLAWFACHLGIGDSAKRSLQGNARAILLHTERGDRADFIQYIRARAPRQPVADALAAFWGESEG